MSIPGSNARYFYFARQHLLAGFSGWRKLHVDAVDYKENSGELAPESGTGCDDLFLG